MTTAGEQFTRDWMMVIENDQDAWNEALEIARFTGHSVTATSDNLRQNYEVAISQALDVLESSDVAEVTINLMRQILIGWGQSEFDDLARDIIERDPLNEN